MSEAGVTEVVSMINAMVSRDGGEVILDEFDPASRTLEVTYKQGANDECDTCAISPDLVHTFLEESLNSHGIPVDVVKVRST